ncbi:MAG: MFS transporter [Candidatus Eremiobacteraeota bacterium]|nr:MFS transporter [Candidatus Eremiobacteraeota bacterium]
MGKVHYAWVVAAVAFFVLLVAAGIRSTPGVIMLPIEHDMGWSAQAVSAAAAVNIALFGLTGPFAAGLMQTFGLRNTMVLGLCVTAAGILAAGFSRAPWELVLTWGVVAGIGLGTLAMVLAATIANRWFVKQRGLVMGALTASTATGQLIFLPLLASMAVAHGWRSSTWIVGAAALVAIVPGVLFIRDRPQSIGLLPYGGTEADAIVPQRGGNPIALAFGELRRASKTGSFWILAGTFFICGASTNGLIGTHFIAACGDHGIPEVRAASLLAAMGIFDLIGTTASGWLSDRVDNRVLLFVYYGLRGLSLLYLPAALDASFGGLAVFTVFYGLDWIATIPPTVRLSNKAFGVEASPLVFGWIAAAHQLGAGTVAFAAGAMRTSFASYTPAFTISGLLCIAAAFAILALRGERRATTLAPA